MVVQAERITRDINPGDRLVVDGTHGRAHLRPAQAVLDQFRSQIAQAAEAREAYRELVGRPATTRDGHTITLKMNAGVLADLPSLADCGAEGVGLYRTELQFMVRQRMPRRDAQTKLYARILDAANGAEVIFRTLDIGSDKVLPFMRREREANPALGWRAIRVGLDRPRLLGMQIQALIRATAGRSLSIMFPMITEADEYYRARAMVMDEVIRQERLGHPQPAELKVGLMFEVPALLTAPDKLYRMADFVSVGGNDLLQFYFAADRENERVRQRYDTLSIAYLDFLRQIVARCAEHGTRLSYCGEAASLPLDAIALAAIGFRELSMRAVSIGPVKQALLETDLGAARTAIDDARRAGERSARSALAGVAGL